MRQARATRYYAEANGGASYIDVVEVQTAAGEFEMSYEQFIEFFQMEIKKGHEVAFEINSTKIPEAKCDLAR